MPINYSLMARSTAPHDPNARWLVYASAQSSRTVGMRDIAEHLAAHGSPFSVGTIIGLLEDAQRCITEQLANGNRVDLGELGAFFTTISSRGVADAEDFSPEMVSRVNLRWRPSRTMMQRVASEPLVEMPTVRSQHELKRRQKATLTATVAATDQQ